MTPRDEMSTGTGVALYFNFKSDIHEDHPTSLKTYFPLTYQLSFLKAQFQTILTLKSVHRKGLFQIWIIRKGGTE